MLGVSVLASVFSSHGSYASPQAFVNGLVPAMWIGTGVLAAGALIAAALPFGVRAAAGEEASKAQTESGAAQVAPAAA